MTKILHRQKREVGWKQIHSGEACSVWEQLGHDPRFAEAHNIKQPRHAGNMYIQFSKFLSVKNQTITLQEDSCMCNACFLDAKKHCICAEKKPHWVGIHITSIEIQSHCPLYHNDWDAASEQCPCPDVTSWLPSSTWTCELDINVWKNYFDLTRKQFYEPLKTSSVICKKHYMEIYHHFKKAECIYCQTKNTLSLGFVGILKSAIARNSLSENSQNISETDWLCCNCKKIINDKLKPVTKEHKLSHRPPLQLMEKILLSNLVKVKTQGYILRKHIIQEFRIALEDLPSEKNGMDFQFDSFLSYEIKKRPELGLAI